MSLAENNEAATTTSAVEIGHVDIKAISQFRLSESDTGSAEVQIAQLTHRLLTPTAHSGLNPNDTHSRRGMMKVISRRKKLLSYLKESNSESYKKTISALGLRK